MSNYITGHTRLVCLLGDPVSHSISPAMHNTAFSRWNLDYTYLALKANVETLDSTIETLRNINVLGFNLTMPIKKAILPLCDKLSPAAKISGSVNTVVNDNGILTGHTTDGIGFMLAAKEAGYDLIGKKMTLLGAGGAGTSILVQAALDGVSEISVFNRRSASFDEMTHTIQALKEYSNCSVSLYDYEDMTVLKREINDSYILVNATSVGMSPNCDTCILPDSSYLNNKLIVSDIIYNPKMTKLLSMAQECSCPTFNGLYMLLYQGAEAFRLWTGKEMPIEEIKSKFFG